MRRRRLIASLAKTRSGHTPATLPKPKGRKVTAEERMNKGEQQYAAVLEGRRFAGEIAAWYFEPFNWRLAENTFYRPDFLVMYADGTLEVHEVKGRKKGKDGKPDTYWAEEDAKLKIKLVAEQMPIPIVIVWPNLDGSWQELRP